MPHLREETHAERIHLRTYESMIYAPIGYQHNLAISVRITGTRLSSFFTLSHPGQIGERESAKWRDDNPWISNSTGDPDNLKIFLKILIHKKMCGRVCDILCRKTGTINVFSSLAHAIETAMMYLHHLTTFDRRESMGNEETRCIVHLATSLSHSP